MTTCVETGAELADVTRGVFECSGVRDVLLGGVLGGMLVRSVYGKLIDDSGEVWPVRWFGVWRNVELRIGETYCVEISWSGTARRGIYLAEPVKAGLLAGRLSSIG